MGRLNQALRLFSLRLWLRIVLGVFLLVLGIILGFLPGPGLATFLAGLVVLGFTVDDVVDICRKVIPGFDDRMAKSILAKPYLRPFRRKQWAYLFRRRRGKDGEHPD